MNSRPLKAYARFDGSGRIVAGSLILRKSKPKVGNWKEVQAYECCNVNQTPILVPVSAIFSYSGANIFIDSVDGDFYQTIYTNGPTGSSNINELAITLNNNVSNLGSFKVINDDLYWTPSINIANFYAANNTTSILMNISFEE
jgi:hypothetical protein